MSRTYDAIIVGGGHNGLVCAAYLAKAGRKVLVLERRHVLGGAAVTEELHPGFHFSVCSYVVSLFRPQIIRDLELARHGLELIPLECSFTPLPDGRSLCTWPDAHRTRREIARFSPTDADVYPEFGLAMVKMAQFAKQLIDEPAPDPGLARSAPADQDAAPRQTGSAISARTSCTSTCKLATMSAVDFLDLWFESDVLKAPMSVSGIIGTFLGVRSPGHRLRAAPSLHGRDRRCVPIVGPRQGRQRRDQPRRRRGRRALRREIRTRPRLSTCSCATAAAEGVVLEGGDEIRANVVVSALDPHRTFLRLVGEDHLDRVFVTQIKRFKFRGSSGKVNLAVDRLPDFTCRPRDGRADTCAATSPSRRASITWRPPTTRPSTATSPAALHQRRHPVDAGSQRRAAGQAHRLLLRAVRALPHQGAGRELARAPGGVRRRGRRHACRVRAGLEGVDPATARS